MLDRRRNWVFMRAEDYAKMDPKTGKSLLGDDHAEDDNMTAMERFYHRLEQSGKSSTTNGFSQLIPDRDHSKAATDSFGSALPNTDAGPFSATPFNAAQQAEYRPGQQCRDSRRRPGLGAHRFSSAIRRFHAGAGSRVQGQPRS